MIFISDSAIYENAGKMFYQNGWSDFFRIKWSKEPLYSALIALFMAFANFLSMDYQIILKIFQVALLFSTQILLAVILRRLDLHNGVISSAIFYFGISPAMINAAFSIYYEIISLPFVAAVVLLAGSLWDSINKNGSFASVLGKSILFGICFSLLALGRSVFQYVFYFFMFPFCVFVFFISPDNRIAIIRRLLIFVFVASAIFYFTASYIKTMNLRSNGNYALSNADSDILLGSAYKRTQPITFRIIASHIVSVPGTGVCRLFFSKEECDYASWLGSCQFRPTVVAQKMATVSQNRQMRESIRLTAKKIIEHPFQYIFFSITEALKMPFWESTQIGFVDYPKPLAKFYSHALVRLGLRLLCGVMTISAFIFVTISLCRERLRHFSLLLPVWLMMTGYTFFYSLCYVVTRFALPIVSMYIICISFTADAMIRGNFTKNA
jgi:hypothetical protein